MSGLQIGAAGAAFAIAFAAVQVLLARFARFALDHPNERSSHASPVPRSGGIAVLAGTCVSFFLDGNQIWLPLALALGLAAVSLADDLRPLPAAARLAAHLAAAAVVVWYYLAPMAWWQAAVLVVGVAWLTNLYNFMDGSDGLAGGMTVIGFGTYALAAGGFPLATVSCCIAAAAGAFLVFNFHPARIFLGDVGSIPLGFLAGALGLVGWRDDAWPLWFPLVVFAPFILDATLTLARRALRGERVWQAHREHYYQRMVRSGLGHRGTAAVAYVAMAVCSLVALWMRPPA